MFQCLWNRTMSNTTIISLINDLTTTCGVSGYEQQMGITQVIYNRAKSISKNTYIDKFGNVVVQKGSGKISVLLEAHMDEVGICTTNKIGKNK